MDGVEPEAWQKARQSLAQVSGPVPVYASSLFPAAAAAAAQQQAAAGLYAYSGHGSVILFLPLAAHCSLSQQVLRLPHPGPERVWRRPHRVASVCEARAPAACASCSCPTASAAATRRSAGRLPAECIR